jgi:hypothetical protein
MFFDRRKEPWTMGISLTKMQDDKNLQERATYIDIKEDQEITVPKGMEPLGLPFDPTKSRFMGGPVIVFNPQSHFMYAPSQRNFDCGTVFFKTHGLLGHFSSMRMTIRDRLGRRDEAQEMPFIDAELGRLNDKETQAVFKKFVDTNPPYDEFSRKSQVMLFSRIDHFKRLNAQARKLSAPGAAPVLKICTKAVPPLPKPKPQPAPVAAIAPEPQSAAAVALVQVAQDQSQEPFVLLPQIYLLTEALYSHQNEDGLAVHFDPNLQTFVLSNPDELLNLAPMPDYTSLNLKGILPPLDDDPPKAKKRRFAVVD